MRAIYLIFMFFMVMSLSYGVQTYVVQSLSSNVDFNYDVENDALVINVSLWNHAPYYFDGYVVYDIYRIVDFEETMARSVSLKYPLVERRVYAVDLGANEYKSLVLTVNTSRFSDGEYGVNVYVFKDRRNIIGNYVSYESPYTFNFVVKNGFEDMVAYISRYKTNVVGGFGQSGPKVNLVENISFVPGYVYVYNPNNYSLTLEIYVCDYSSLPLFGDVSSIVSEGCSYVESYEVSQSEGVDLRISYDDLKYGANQIVYILKNQNGDVVDFYENRLIFPYDKAHIVEFNYLYVNDTLNVGIIFTGPYYPHMADSEPTSIKICAMAENEVCKSYDLLSIFTDNETFINFSFIGDYEQICLNMYNESYCKHVVRSSYSKSYTQIVVGDIDDLSFLKDYEENSDGVLWVYLIGIVVGVAILVALYYIYRGRR